MRPEVCVIIPMYGHHEMTEKCVNMTKELAGMDIDVIVVDDGSPEPFKTDSCQVVTLPKNLGFTGAHNAGMIWCGNNYKYQHFQNNDIEPKQDYIKKLYDVLESNPVIGIAVSTRLITNHAPFSYELFGVDLLRGYQQMADAPLPQELCHVRWAPLPCALVRYEMIQHIGLLDRRMKIWSSDLDYCLRANIAGWNVTLVRDSQAVHAHAATTSKLPSEFKLKQIESDQKVLLGKLSGWEYAQLLTELPLDADSKTYGKIEFSTYVKK